MTDDALPSAIISNLEINFIDALRVLKFVNSNGEARRLIKGNGAKINDIVINDENHSLSKEDFNNGHVKISSGKKRHGLLIKK
jgi:tyrosyl-tRNA synthetase